MHVLLRVKPSKLSKRKGDTDKYKLLKHQLNSRTHVPVQACTDSRVKAADALQPAVQLSPDVILQS